MQMERVVLLVILSLVKLAFLTSCGKGLDSNEVCRPQSVRIAECIAEEFEKNPNRLMIEYQRQYCERLFPINMCYYR